MVRIRLRRTGKTKQPSYRIVVADSRSPRDGKFIEIIGHYNPVQNPKVLKIKGDRARYWLSVGASPSETITYLFKQQRILDKDGCVMPEYEEHMDDVSTDVVHEANQTSVPQETVAT